MHIEVNGHGFFLLGGHKFYFFQLLVQPNIEQLQFLPQFFVLEVQLPELVDSSVSKNVPVVVLANTGKLRFFPEIDGV